MHDDQVTLRIPRELARALRQQAKERDVPASHIVREALQAYLGTAMSEDPATTWARVGSLVGSISIDADATERDALAAQIRRHNWRE